MATPAWPPLPLNSHQNSDVQVRIRESSQPEHFHTKRKFRIVATVDVFFYSNTAQMAFRGLSIWKSELIDVNNRETLAASLRREFLDDDGLIPFPLAPCSWTEEHYDRRRRRRWSPPLRLSGSDELVQRISDFVALADGRPGNKNLKLVEARLQITKMVAAAEAEAEGFAAWIAWYEEQKRVRRNFAVEYVRALSGLAEPEEECCSICLEELSGGGVAGLPCRHRFHVDCINRWLEGNRVCPLCRYKLHHD